MDATLLEKVETSIESNKSLQRLYIYIGHSIDILPYSRVVEAILKGARGNTSLKRLSIWQYYGQRHLNTVKTAAAELRQVRPQLELLI